MPIFLLLGAGALAFLFMNKSSQGGSVSNRLFNLPDVLPENQGGNYKKDYDIHFETVANETGVPFALLKAHAIAESSLNAKAFRNENPSNRSDRQGWASRGLMQILWWPGSDRFKKYGYPDSKLGTDGEMMFDPYTNISIAAQLIRDNLNSCAGNIRDTINMYNTGKKEAQFQAPNNYVGKVLGYYETIIKEKVV